jgi:hypothetical protein
MRWSPAPLVPLVLLAPAATAHGYQEDPAVPAKPATPPPVDPIDTSIKVVLGRPLLVVGTTEMNLRLLIDTGKVKRERTAANRLELELIDEHSMLDETSETATRTFVKVFQVTDGEISDPPLNGVKLTFIRNSGGRELKLDGRRMLGQRELNGLLRTAPSAGFWLAMPKEARIGASYRVDLTPLAPLLLSDEMEEMGGEAELVFESFDPEAGLARFRGPAKLSGQGPIDELHDKASYEGECLIEVDVKEARIARLTLGGKMIMEMSLLENGAVIGNGDGTFKVSFTTETGPPVAEAAERNPVVRQRVFPVEFAGISLSLPSFYGKLKDPSTKFLVRRMLDNEQTIMITVDAVAANDMDPKAYLEAVLEQVKQKSPDATTENVTSPLGDGQAFLIERDMGEGQTLYIRSEFYPVDKSWVVVKLQTDPKSQAVALGEFTKARESLKLLKK